MGIKFLNTNDNITYLWDFNKVVKIKFIILSYIIKGEKLQTNNLSNRFKVEQDKPKACKWKINEI